MCVKQSITHITVWWTYGDNTYTDSDDTTLVRCRTRIAVCSSVPVLLNMLWWRINNSPESGMWRARSRSLSFVSALVCDLLSRMGLVGKLGHTGLVPFVDELGSVCWEVPLEYGFEVLVWSEQHTTCFLMYNRDCVILSSAPGVSAGKHQWEITQSCVTMKLISTGFGILCWLPSRLPVPCWFTSHPSGVELLD